MSRLFILLPLALCLAACDGEPSEIPSGDSSSGGEVTSGQITDETNLLQALEPYWEEHLGLALIHSIVDSELVIHDERFFGVAVYQGLLSDERQGGSPEGPQSAADECEAQWEAEREEAEGDVHREIQNIRSRYAGLIAAAEQEVAEAERVMEAAIETGRPDMAVAARHLEAAEAQVALLREEQHGAVESAESYLGDYISSGCGHAEDTEVVFGMAFIDGDTSPDHWEQEEHLFITAFPLGLSYDGPVIGAEAETVVADFDGDGAEEILVLAALAIGDSEDSGHGAPSPRYTVEELFLFDDTGRHLRDVWLDRTFVNGEEVAYSYVHAGFEASDADDEHYDLIIRRVQLSGACSCEDGEVPAIDGFSLPSPDSLAHGWAHETWNCSSTHRTTNACTSETGSSRWSYNAQRQSWVSLPDGVSPTP